MTKTRSNANENYYNDFSNNTNDSHDLYEFDVESSQGLKSHVKNFLGSAQIKSDDDTHSNYHFKKDILDSFCSQINQTLLIPKAFYFFFFAAFGSLFPLMAIYFKQMAMSPVQVGILFGLRPFVEFLSVPFWANMGEKLKKGKTILLGSLLCWILFTLGVGFIKPPVHSCLMHNETHIFLEKSKSGQLNIPTSNKIISGGYNVINKRSVNEIDYFQTKKFLNYKSMRKTRSDNSERIVKYINVTKIIKIKKTSSIPDLSTLSTIFTSKSKKINSNKVKIEDETDELEFGFENKLIKTENLQEKNSSFNIKNFKNSTFEINHNPKLSKIYQKETNSINKIIEGELNNFVDNHKDDKNEIISEKTQVESKINSKPKKIIQASVDEYVKLNFVEKQSKPIEKTHYFDSDPLDSTKTRSKIIYINDSTLRLVKPSLQTSIVYHKNDVHKVFLVFLIFILAGEFFSAPAITLADTCTLQYLGQSRADLYGRQRMFGSLGWALAMFSVGILLDNSKAFTDHPCGKAGPDERNYTVCFAIYSVLMGCAFIIALQFKFDYGDSEQIPLKSIANTIRSKVNKVRGEKYQQFDSKILENESDDYSDESYNKNMNSGSATVDAKFEIAIEGDSKYKRLFVICKSLKNATFLFVVWFMGIGVGIVFTFLFWHLQDLGGTPALYGIASVINHMSELMAYFFVHQIVRKYGHVKIFYAGLLGNFVRFVYVSLLTEPYWILPFEFIQGITHALVWAAATSYFAQSVPDDLRSTSQGVLQGIHFGLGRGCGAIFGGFFITYFGTKVTFALYGIMCLITLLSYFAISHIITNNAIRQNPSYSTNDVITDDILKIENPNVNLNNKMNESQIGNTIDSNFYYQHSSSNEKSDLSQSKLNSTTKSSFPIAPHGVPSTNPNWTKQFSNKMY